MLKALAITLPVFLAIATASDPVGTWPACPVPNRPCTLEFRPTNCCVPGAETPCTADNDCLCKAIGGKSGCSTGGGKIGGGGDSENGCTFGGPVPEECTFIMCPSNQCCTRREDNSPGCVPDLSVGPAPPSPDFPAEVVEPTTPAPLPEKPEPLPETPSKPRRKPCLCPRIYRPVCCRRRNGHVYSASNKCVCECDGRALRGDWCLRKRGRSYGRNRKLLY